ncbi:MAG: hypothetical protein Q8942_19060 [Bacillota bacterium]|nr:hypothetical protein [Bacillota bacterium]
MDMELELVKLCNVFLTYINELYEDDKINITQHKELSENKLKFLHYRREKVSP